MTEEAKKGKSPSILIFVGVCLAIGVGLIMLRQKIAPDAQDKPKTVEKVDDGLVTDEERKAYIASFIVIHDLVIEADTQIGPEGEPVVTPGLLKVAGSVENTGEKGINKLVLVVNPLDGEKKVIGSYREDLSAGRVLDAGQKKEFRFTIPEKKAWGGEFEHSVR